MTTIKTRLAKLERLSVQPADTRQMVVNFEGRGSMRVVSVQFPAPNNQWREATPDQLMEIQAQVEAALEQIEAEC